MEIYDQTQPTHSSPSVFYLGCENSNGPIDVENFHRTQPALSMEGDKANEVS